MADHEALKLVDVKKSFGKNQVLRGVTLSVFAGEVALIAGSNGAGKSTLLRICAALTRPDNGIVEFYGAKSAPFAGVGYVTHEPLLYGALTLRENIDLIAKIRGEPRESSAAICAWGLEEFSERKVCELSKGLQGRAALCRAFLGHPRILLLDEPSSSLDDSASRLLCAKIAEFIKHSNRCVLLVTHDFTRFSSVASRVVVLKEGSIWRDSGSAREASAKDQMINSFLEINR